MSFVATLLVVDDVAVIRRIVRRAIAKVCPTALVIAASTITEARQALQQRAVTAIITDYHLPDGTGLDVLRAAHAYNPTMRVVVMSTDATLATTSRSAGAYAFVSKPFDMSALLLYLEQLCDSQ
jgi:DNA-binding NtrC family response regulator